MTGSAFGMIADETQQSVALAAFNAMPAKLIIKYHDREHLWATEDTSLLAAIDKVFRRRLATGKSVFLSSTATPASGRTFLSVVIPPDAWVQFSCTDHDGEPSPKLTALVEDQVERFGGLVLGPGDKIVKQR